MRMRKSSRRGLDSATKPETNAPCGATRSSMEPLNEMRASRNPVAKILLPGRSPNLLASQSVGYRPPTPTVKRSCRIAFRKNKPER